MGRERMNCSLTSRFNKRASPLNRKGVQMTPNPLLMRGEGWRRQEGFPGNCMWTCKKIQRCMPACSAGRPSNNSKGERREGRKAGRQTYFESPMPIDFDFSVRRVWQVQLVACSVSIHLFSLPVEFQFWFGIQLKTLISLEFLVASVACYTVQVHWGFLFPS